MLIDLHDRCLVSTSVAVVWRREDRDNIAILRPVVTLHNQLMSSSDQRKTVVVVERFRDILAERVSRTSWRYSPSAAVIWIGPEEIAHWAFVRNLLNTVESSDVVQGIDGWGETAVEAEDLVVDEGGERQVVEEVGEVLPDVCVAVLTEALVVKAVDLGDLARLVVSTEDGDTLWVADLEGNEEGNSLDGVVATVDIVAYKAHLLAKTTPPLAERAASTYP